MERVLNSVSRLASRVAIEHLDGRKVLYRDLLHQVLDNIYCVPVTGDKIALVRGVLSAWAFGRCAAPLGTPLILCGNSTL